MKLTGTVILMMIYMGVAKADEKLMVVTAVKSNDGNGEANVISYEEEPADNDDDDTTTFARRTGKQYTIQDDNQRGRSGQVDQLVSDIHCLRASSTETFTAFLRLPDGFSAPPVLEDRPSSLSDPVLDGTCLIAETNVQGIFALDISQLEACGVRQCTNEADDDPDEASEWLCVLVRFPVMTGLKLPEDEVIDIKCKPQERLVQGENTINFQRNAVEHLSPTIYLGGGHDFLSEIGLFRRLAGTDLFASRVKSGSTIELGENVQLRSIVRGGDGWNFAKITDVVVHRVHDGHAMRDSGSTARLVNDDGCRNPEYRVLAPQNPWRDSQNSLISNFDFRVFMFQDMESGDSIMITARVVACVEEIDCAPARCGADRDYGYGRRRRRSVSNSTANHTGLNQPAEAKTKNWEENLELKIRLPEDLIEGHIKVSESECKLYLIITLAVAMTFCVLSAAIVLVACIKRCRELKQRRLVEKQDHASDIDLDHERYPDGTVLHQTSIADHYMTNCDKIQRSLQFRQQFIPGDVNHMTPSNRPVTVRSVKRRDKAKSEEKSRMQQLQQLESAKFDRKLQDNHSWKEDEAVMV